MTSVRRSRSNCFPPHPTPTCLFSSHPIRPASDALMNEMGKAFTPAATSSLMELLVHGEDLKSL